MLLGWQPRQRVVKDGHGMILTNNASCKDGISMAVIYINNS